MYRIQIQRLSVGSLFKILYFGSLAPILSLVLIASLIAGIGSLAGLDSLSSVNGKPLTGVNGALQAALAAVIGSLLLPLLILPHVFFLWVYLSFGLWIYSKFRPMTLDYVPAPKVENHVLVAESEPA